MRLSTTTTASSSKINMMLLLVLLVATTSTILLLNVQHVASQSGPLMFDEYLKQPGPAMSYSLSATTSYSDCTVYTLTMKGVNWLTEAEIGSGHSWTHYLIVSIPKTMDQSIKEGFLLIEGGTTTMSMPKGNSLVQAISTNSQTIASMIASVPNQPIVFSSDSAKTNRLEDQIMSYSWLKFLAKMNANIAQNSTVYNVADYDWIAQFAMAKTSIRAMDVIQDFVSKQIGFSIEKFTIAGASKRGWATWLVGASKDTRVKSLMPVVIQVMNLKECFLHINRSICAWPEALQDYKKLGILDQLHTPAFDVLAQAVDPFNYRDRYTNIPTFMINAMGDEFMWTDLSLLSYQQIPGLSSKSIRYIANTGHSLAGSDAPQTIMAYYHAITRNSVLPQYTFYNETISNGLRVWVKVTNGIKPSKVLLWYGTNTYSRDFRHSHVGPIFQSKTLTEVDSFTWRVDVENPKIGYTAFTIEMAFSGYGPSELKYSTSAYVLPLDRFICAGAHPTTTATTMVLMLISVLIFTLFTL